ncbi:type IV secretion system DNA-binding domain-containing protein, partial [Acinetobacter baumannii]
MILAREEQPTTAKDSGMQQAWFFLDEVREAGELDGLSRLMTKGRSKGACVVLGFQDIDGMRDVYGDQVANEICAQCNNIV